MNILAPILGPNAPLALTFIVAFVIVLILIGLMAWVFRLMRSRGLGIGGSGRGRQPRLAVLDYADVDARRKLVLIRRDNVEHLILLGGPTDVVVETNIVRGVPVPASALRDIAPVLTDLPAETVAPRLSIREQARQAAGETPAKPETKSPALRPEARAVESTMAPASPIETLPPASRPAAEPQRMEPPRMEPPRVETTRSAQPSRIEPALVEPARIEPAKAEPTRSEPRPPQPAGIERREPTLPLRGPDPKVTPPADDDITSRLEAALRKPITPPVLAPARPAVQPTASAPAQAPRPAPLPQAAPPAQAAPAARSLTSEDRSVFDNLEAEMAALLGRAPGGQPPKS